MQREAFDLCVIGGGINGAGIARDAAGRGLKVCLMEAQDLASGTSSASTKLIHGGLRYLQYYDFKLVRDSLKERETLLKLAPHIIWPKEFVLIHRKGMRSSWLIRLGLFLYDNLAKRRYLKGSDAIDLPSHNYGQPLKDDFVLGFLYSDCWVEDSRLVVLNAVDARNLGAKIFNYTKCQKVRTTHFGWLVEGKKSNGDIVEIEASAVVNATGPWVKELLKELSFQNPVAPKIKQVKGSHIIVEKRYDGDHAYLLQQNDGRVVFVIPYENDYTLIGTTEVDYKGDPREAMISDEEIFYLLNVYNQYFEISAVKNDVIWAYSGVRPLIDDGALDNQEITRDYRIFEHTDLHAPFFSIFGGKLTTYRVLAEKVVDKICEKLGKDAKAWTNNTILPGGDIDAMNVEGYVKELIQLYAWVPENLIRRYVRAYGTKTSQILQGKKSLQNMGQHFGDHVYEAEIEYLMRYEFAKTAEDILFRRSKLGLHISQETADKLEAYIGQGA